MFLPISSALHLYNSTKIWGGFLSFSWSSPRFYLISNAVSCYTPNVICKGRFLKSEQSSCCLVGRKINDLTLGSCKFVYSLVVERQSTRKQQVVRLLGPTHLDFVNCCGLIEKWFLVFLIIQYVLKGVFFLLSLVTNSSFLTFVSFTECQIYKQYANIGIHIYV